MIDFKLRIKSPPGFPNSEISIDCGDFIFEDKLRKQLTRKLEILSSKKKWYSGFQSH